MFILFHTLTNSLYAYAVTLLATIYILKGLLSTFVVCDFTGSEVPTHLQKRGLEYIKGEIDFKELSLSVLGSLTTVCRDYPDSLQAFSRMSHNPCFALFIHARQISPSSSIYERVK